MIETPSIEGYLLNEKEQAERLAGRVRFGALGVLLVLQLVLLATGIEELSVVGVSIVAMIIAGPSGA